MVPSLKETASSGEQKKSFFFPPQFTDKAHQPIETCDFFKKHVIFPRNLTQPLGFPGGSEVKAPACKVGDPGSIPGSGRSPGEGKWQPTPVFLPGESHGWRSLVGYSPRGRKESDATEWLHFHFNIASISGEPIKRTRDSVKPLFSKTNSIT